MGEITQRLKELAFTDGTLKNLSVGIEGYIKQASHSPLSDNDQKLFMWHILALIETANEKREEASKFVEESYPHYYTCEPLENLLKTIQKDLEKITESCIWEPGDQYLQANIIGAMMIAIGTGLSKEEVEEILKKYYPESVREELVAV